MRRSLNICLWSSNNLAVSVYAVNILVKEYNKNRKVCDEILCILQEWFCKKKEKKEVGHESNYVYYMMLVRMRVKSECMQYAFILSLQFSSNVYSNMHSSFDLCKADVFYLM